jgi:predicted ATPase/class 3 adenylate cyclase
MEGFHMNSQSEIENLQQAILALEAQRSVLGDAVVESALAPLREKLASLRSNAVGEQRKLVTILFADLVGFTSLSTQIDPEELRDMLKRYFALWNSCIISQGGVVEKYIGDAVMAVFGLPASHEDDPERAVRSALEMRSALEQFNQGQAAAGSPPLEMRVGIHTGEVVVGSMSERHKDEFMAVGETVNLTSRLQSAAPVNGILITHAAYRHIRGLFIVQPYDHLQFRGLKEPTPTYLIEGVQPRTFHRRRRGVEGVETDMVGRQAELERMQAAFQDVARSGAQHTLLIVGDAGIGKSRLLAEFEQWTGDQPGALHLFKGRAFPATQNSPFSLVRDLFASRFEISDSDPPAVVRHKLEQGWVEAFTQDAPGAASASAVAGAHTVGRLLGFELDDHQRDSKPEQEAHAFYDQALIDLRRFFRSLGSSGPILVLLEDLHWADDSSLELFRHLQDHLGDIPVLVVAAARPISLERPGEDWTGLRVHTRLLLGPLSWGDSLQLARDILHKVENIPPDLLDLITSNAEGNPFYIEELVKMLMEDGVIQAGESGWRVEDQRLSELRVPPTLVGVLQARFDSLPPVERAALQHGSVIGRIFWDRALQYLAQGSSQEGNYPTAYDVPDILHHLQTRQMVFQRAQSTFDETNEYLFKHALLRDVTYESLLKKQRRVYHRLAASWLEDVTERIQRPDQFGGLIAAHYEQAGEHAAAARWYRRTGQSAARRYANAEALHAFSRALVLLPEEDVEQRFEVLLAREAVNELLGQPEARRQDLEAAGQLASQMETPEAQARVLVRQAALQLSQSELAAVNESTSQARALAQAAQRPELEAESDLLQAGALLRQGALDEALEIAQHGLALAQDQLLLGLQASCLRQIGLALYYMSQPQEAFPYFEQVYQLYVQTGDRRGQSVALNNMGGAVFENGDSAGAQQYYSRSLELSREIGDLLGEGRAYNNLGITAVVRDEYDQAEAYYLQALEICRKVGHRSFQASALDNLGNLAANRYEFQKAQEYQQEALKLAQQIGDRISESIIALNLAHIYFLTGAHQQSFTFLQAAEPIVIDVGDPSGFARLFTSRCEYYLHQGDLESAEQWGQKALETCREHDLHAEEAQVQHALGEVYAAQGRLAEAQQAFEIAINLYKESEDDSLEVDAAAGLALSLLAAGKLPESLAQVEKILAHFQAESHLGLDKPVYVFLACCQVLRALQDPRANEFMVQGHQLLQEMAAKFTDPASRQAFLDQAPFHPEFWEAWRAFAPQDQEREPPPAPPGSRDQPGASSLSEVDGFTPG